MPKVTMDSLAASLGVSKNTVSRALRGLSGVSDEMRTQIIALADEMGYKMKAKENPLLHVVMIYRKSLTDDVFFWPGVLGGIMDCAADKGISIRALTADTNGNAASLSLALREQKCDGLLIVNDIEDNTLRQLAGLKLPMVVVDYHTDSIDCDYVNTDNQNGIRQAIAHLVAHHHHRIGFISNADRLYSFEERLAAFRHHMGKQALTVDERFIWLDAGYEDYVYLKEKIRLLETADTPPTAFICVNDVMAANFTRALADTGRCVPDDISIIGFDNSTLPGGTAFTTLEVQRRALGLRSLEQLMLRIAAPDRPFETLHINTTLIVRDSVKDVITLK